MPFSARVRYHIFALYYQVSYFPLFPLQQTIFVNVNYA